MNRLFVKICTILISILLLISMTACSSPSFNAKNSLDKKEPHYSKVQPIKNHYISNSLFEPHVESAINDFIGAFGKHSILNRNAYAVSNLDDTLVINDITKQCQAYQVDSMSFAISPDQIREVLSIGIDPSIEDFDLWLDDIDYAYYELWDIFGPFDAKGISRHIEEELHENDLWVEFAAKMRGLLDLVEEKLGNEKARDWLLHLTYGMTPDEVYDLYKHACDMYQTSETEIVTLFSPEDIESQVGPIEVDIKYGASVPEDIKKMLELYKDNKIDIWICADTHIEGVRAALDSFGISENISGIIGFTPKIKDGRYSLDYDYENGLAYKKEGEIFKKYFDQPFKAYCYGKGKTESIKNALIPLYGVGPFAGLMASTADFNFCTEFSSLKMVICFNQGRGTVTEAGPLMGIISLYQEEAFGYNLLRAIKAKDTLYLLQGRDETGKRELIPAHGSLNCGRELVVINDDPAYAALSLSVFALRNTIKDTLHNCALIHRDDEPRNTLGYNCGFLDSYDGYHSL